MCKNGPEFISDNVLTVENMYELLLMDAVYDNASDISPDANKLRLFNLMTVAKASLYRIIKEIKEDYELNGIEASFVEIDEALCGGEARAELSLINKIRGHISEGHGALEDYKEYALMVADDTFK